MSAVFVNIRLKGKQSSFIHYTELGRATTCSTCSSFTSIWKMLLHLTGCWVYYEKRTGSLWTCSYHHVSPLIQTFNLLLSPGGADDSQVSFLLQYVSSVLKALFPTYTSPSCRSYLVLCYKYTASSFSEAPFSLSVWALLSEGQIPRASLMC